MEGIESVLPQLGLDTRSEVPPSAPLPLASPHSPWSTAPRSSDQARSSTLHLDLFGRPRPSSALVGHLSSFRLGQYKRTSARTAVDVHCVVASVMDSISGAHLLSMSPTGRTVQPMFGLEGWRPPGTGLHVAFQWFGVNETLLWWAPRTYGLITSTGAFA